MATNKVKDLLQEGRGYSHLKKLLRHTANQQAWTDQLRAALDNNLKNHVEVSDLRGAKLIIKCSSAGVATRIRFGAPELISRLVGLSAFCRVEELVLKVHSTERDN
jgi:hypothetical protein